MFFALVTSCCCHCPLWRWRGFCWASRRLAFIFTPNWEEWWVKGQELLPEAPRVCSVHPGVLWLQPSTCHQAGIQTADAHLHIHADVSQQLNYNFLWALICLSCPLEEQEMWLCRWRSNDLWLFAWIWWSSGSCPRWAHISDRVQESEGVTRYSWFLSAPRLSECTHGVFG